MKRGKRGVNASSFLFSVFSTFENYLSSCLLYDGLSFGCEILSVAACLFDSLIVLFCLLITIRDSFS